MADSTIQVLEGLFASPVMAEDEYGQPLADMKPAAGLKPTFSTLTPQTTAGMSLGTALVGFGLLYWFFLRE